MYTNYTCINYTVFFRFLSSVLTYDNYCTCHLLINCIYQDILLLSMFFSVASRAIVVFYFRFGGSNNCYYFFLCNVVCCIVIFSFRFCPVSPTHYYTYTSVIYRHVSGCEILGIIRALTPLFWNGAGAFRIGKNSVILTKIGKN